jgi:hypothetical protein
MISTSKPCAGKFKVSMQNTEDTKMAKHSSRIRHLLVAALSFFALAAGAASLGKSFQSSYESCDNGAYIGCLVPQLLAFVSVIAALLLCGFGILYVRRFTNAVSYRRESHRLTIATEPYRGLRPPSE